MAQHNGRKPIGIGVDESNGANALLASMGGNEWKLEGAKERRRKAMRFRSRSAQSKLFTPGMQATFFTVSICLLNNLPAPIQQC